MFLLGLDVFAFCFRCRLTASFAHSHAREIRRLNRPEQKATLMPSSSLEPARAIHDVPNPREKEDDRTARNKTNHAPAREEARGTVRPLALTIPGRICPGVGDESRLLR